MSLEDVENPFADLAYMEIPLDIMGEAVADRGNEKSGGTTTARRDGQRQREKGGQRQRKVAMVPP